MDKHFFQKTFFIFLLYLGKCIYGQSPNTYFDAHNPNTKYLEHLIKIGIDEIRKSHELNDLVNDSILYIASKDHAFFLQKLGRLSHKQVNNQSKLTPQLRAEFFGAINYNVGENIASMPFGAKVAMKSGKEISTTTYGSIAEAFVDGWVNSPGHYKNIITPEYEITGVSVSIDLKKEVIFACQKFAQVNLRFVFDENEAMFPYSNYSPPPVATSFEGIPNKLIVNYKYPFKLRHNKLEKCLDCPNKQDETPDISLAFDERKGFVLRVENAAFVQKLIRNKYDGFAVELVDYVDYACRNGAYYEKPSRRNGQTLLNGILLEPKFRDDLLRGYKKRKKIKEIRFMNYIFSKNSVSFFKRFGHFKTDKFSSEYFEINLGKLPKNAPPFNNHNLVVIKDKQICDIYYFTSYCGDLFEDYIETSFIPYQYNDFKYSFKLNTDSIQFSVPFKQGEYDFDSREVLSNISSLSKYDFIIDSVNIYAYSSIEGDSIINTNLQVKRGEKIANIFQGIQEVEIKKTINTLVNWSDFRNELNQSVETKHFNQLKNEELKKKVDLSPEKFEKQLATSRKGDVRVFFHIIPNSKSLNYYIKKEFIKLDRQIMEHKRQRINYDTYLEKMVALYSYTYAMVKEGNLDVTFFLTIPFPSYKQENPHLIQYFLLFGTEFNSVYSRLPHWKSDSTNYMNNYLYTNSSKLLPEFNYMTLKILCDLLVEKKSISEKEFNLIESKVKNLKNYYQENEFARENMDKMNFNFNILALNHLYKENPNEQQHNAIIALSQVYQYFENKGLMCDTLAMQLAKIAVFYQNPNKGIQFILPYQNKNHEISTYINEVSYQHSSLSSSKSYYQKLIIDFEKIDTYIWCNMFFKPCGIPFQAFDYEPLRNLYCNECIGKNDYLNKIYYRK